MTMDVQWMDHGVDIWGVSGWTMGVPWVNKGCTMVATMR